MAKSKPTCSRGYSCGFGCISQRLVCHKNVSENGSSLLEDYTGFLQRTTAKPQETLEPFDWENEEGLFVEPWVEDSVEKYNAETYSTKAADRVSEEKAEVINAVLSKDWQALDEHTQTVQTLLNQSKTVVAAPKESLEAILNDGLKNQFETRKTAGTPDLDVRLTAEAVAFGVPLDAPIQLKPKYGERLTQGEIESNNRQSGYGDIDIVLKQSLDDRTTVTLGDSLDQESRAASPVQNIGPEFFHSSSDYNADLNQPIDVPPTKVSDLLGGSGPFKPNYIEAQVHGQLSSSDIESIAVHSNTFAALPDSTKRALEAAGIPVHIRDGSYNGLVNIVDTD